MKLKKLINQEMKLLAKHSKVVFLGENVTNSGRIYGTLEDVPMKKCIEMPICENLIAGVAIGLALDGWIPVCIFQRMDFMLIAADAIINHACLMEKMSGGKIKLPIIFRTIKANLNNKFWVGHQHSKDFTYIFRDHLKTYTIPTPDDVDVYRKLIKTEEPVLVVEDYGYFEKEI